MNKFFLKTVCRCDMNKLFSFFRLPVRVCFFCWPLFFQDVMGEVQEVPAEARAARGHVPILMWARLLWESCTTGRTFGSPMKTARTFTKSLLQAPRLNMFTPAGTVRSIWRMTMSTTMSGLQTARTIRFPAVLTDDNARMISG